MLRSLRPVAVVVSLASPFAGSSFGDDAPAKPSADDAKPKQTAVRIGKETTRITEPLDADGFVDYVEAANRLQSKGVTAENNFEVVVRRAMGPEAISEDEREEYHRRLGMRVPSVNGVYFEDFFSYLGRTAPGLDPDDIDDAYNRLRERPWTVDDSPRGARWLSKNRKLLDAVAEGAKRPRNYTPYLTGEFEEDEPFPRLIAVLLPSVQQYRELARAFAMRAMHNIGEGRIDAAWDDVRTLHRIGHHAASGITLIDLLVGIAIEGIAFDAERALLASRDLTDEQLKKCLADLSARPAMKTVAEKIDVGERWMGLDTVMSLARVQGADVFRMLNLIGDLSDAGSLEEFERFATTTPAFATVQVSFDDEPGDDEKADPKLPSPIDWNVSLKLMNEWYDRLVAAAREPDSKKRAKAFEKLDADLKKLSGNARDSKRLANGVFGGEAREAMGRFFGEVLVALLLPATSQTKRAEDLAVARRHVVRLSYALELHRRETGAYPRELAALAPKYVRSIPVDAVSGEPLKYAASRTGFTLYSVGRNGRDDKGRTREEQEGADDIVIRVE